MDRYGVEYFNELAQAYERASRDTQKVIIQLYNKLAANNKISMKEAKKLLTSNELKEFRWSVNEYIEYARLHSLDETWITKLENAGLKYRISRLEAMRVQMQNSVEVLMATELDGITELMSDIYTESYYRTGHALQTGLGIGYSFAALDTKQVELIIHKPWVSDGSNFSERIWGKHRPQLINELHTGLTQAIIRGQSTDKLVDHITKRFDVAKSRAENLVRTERAFFSNVAMQKSYEELGVDYQQFCATLDLRTSEMCREMDGTIIATKDIDIGVNAPPLHCRCRSVMIPYIEGNIKQRAARNKDGKTIYVDGNMTYKEWYKQFVEGEK